MPINPDAVGTTSEPERRRWTSKDSLIYALGVGAGAEDPLAELEFTTENSQDVTQRALPTMPVVLGAGVAGAFASIGIVQPGDARARRAVGRRWPASCPSRASSRPSTEIVGIYDKGSGARRGHRDAGRRWSSDGQPLFTTRSGAFIRGEGGFGGDRGPSLEVRARPTGRPTTRSPTRPAPTRRCSTACRATATRCTPTRSSRRWPASTGRSSTGCAPTASPAGRCSTRCAAATRRASGR